MIEKLKDCFVQVGDNPNLKKQELNPKEVTAKINEIIEQLNGEQKRAKPTKRLFVWADFAPDYTSGLAFAIAKNEGEARKLVMKHYGFQPHSWGELHTHSLTRSIGYGVGGGG